MTVYNINKNNTHYKYDYYSSTVDELGEGAWKDV